MKSVFNKILCGLIFLTVSVQADDVMQADSKSTESFMSQVYFHLNNFGVAINDLNFPLIGKLGRILPFALVSFSLRKFPGQTLLVAGGALLYAMYHNDNVSKFLSKYNLIGATKAKKAIRNQQREVVLEDDFFVSFLYLKKLSDN